MLQYLCVSRIFLLALHRRAALAYHLSVESSTRPPAVFFRPPYPAHPVCSLASRCHSVSRRVADLLHQYIFAKYHLPHDGLHSAPLLVISVAALGSRVAGCIPNSHGCLLTGSTHDYRGCGLGDCVALAIIWRG